MEDINYCVAGQRYVQGIWIGCFHTFVALGRTASAGTVGILGHFPAPGTSDRLRLGNRRLELDHRLVRIQLEVVEADLVQGGNSVLLEVGWGRSMVRYLH